jgi:glycosyltransferase involved in cell wall biosynthesis
MKTLSIVIPVYNEKKTISAVLDAVNLVDIGEIKKEIIVVDDFSKDGTQDVLKTYQNKPGFKVFFHEKNKGKGSAVKLGFSKSTGDYVIIQDADLEYNPNEYKELISPLVENKADVVYGSRFVGDKPHRVLFFWHYLGNKFLTTLSNIFTNLNLTDMETCYKVFTKQALTKILPHLKSQRFGIEPEITGIVSELNLRIYEVGISYSGRTYEEGKKINWKDGVSAIWTIIKTKYRFSSFGKDLYKPIISILLIIIPLVSILVFNPKMDGGDSQTYVEAINFLKNGVSGVDFVPNRIVTTYLGLRSIMFLTSLTGSLYFSWLFINILLFIFGFMFFYKLVSLMFSPKVSFWSTILLATNYSAINFGPAFLMDMGGWAFYIVSVYFAFKYLSSENKTYFWLSSILISLGGLWKEYAFLGLIVLFLTYIYLNYKNGWFKVLKTMFLAGVFVFSPILLLNLVVYLKFHYTYANWFSYQAKYVYGSRIIEYIKAFGSLYNFGWFLFLPGLYIFSKKIVNQYGSKLVDDENKKDLFVLFVLISTLPFLVWPAITQRVLFIAIPGIILVTSYFLEKITSKYYILIPILTLYVLSNFLMNSYILKIINL